MKYCKYLKKRKNKPYCNIIRKEISLFQCRECDKKEYHVLINYKTKNNKKSTIFVKNDTFGDNLSPKNAKKVQNMKFKSNKLAKLERTRFSVFTNNDKCFICDSTYQLTWNEIYRGRNRTNSMKYGFCLRMCLNCHREYQEDMLFCDYWHKTAQKYFEEHYGTRDKFIKTFRNNYLD